MRKTYDSVVVCLALCLTQVGFGQSSNAQVAFDVASIKLSGPNSIRGWDGGPGSSNPLRYIFGQATLLDLITVAYDTNFAQQVSSKSSLSGDAFDLAVNVPAGATKEQFRRMMQNLLAERFHLKLHVESKDLPAFELVIAKSGSKLKNSGTAPLPNAVPNAVNDDGYPALPPNVPAMAAKNQIVDGYNRVRLNGQQQTIAALIRGSVMTKTPNGEPIVDRTGLTGKYDFKLEYATEFPGPAPSAPPPAPSLFTAIREQLGLELVSKKLLFDCLVIESFDRVPSDN